MNNILNEKIEKAKLENDTLTSKLFGRTIKYNNDSTIKTEYEIELKNKNDKNNNYNNNTINSRINLPNMPKNGYNKQIIISKKKLSREQLNEIIKKSL